MPKPKPKWGRSAGIGLVLSPQLSDECRKNIIGIVDIENKQLDDYLQGLRGIVDIYAMRKKEREEWDYTGGSLKAAALAIKKQTELLAGMLSGDAGGVKAYIEAPVSLPLRESHGFIFLEEFVELLKGVEKGCNDCLEDNSTDTEGKKRPRLKELFARDVMEHYSTFFNEAPKTTLSLEHGGVSKYAQILKACFLEVDNDIPSDGDLKRLMSWALNNRKRE